MSRKICDECEGAGTIHTLKGAYNRFELCEKCNGNGYIIIE